MLALRVSCSFTRPALVAGRLSFIARSLSTIPVPDTALGFLGHDAPASEPTPFQVDDGPPTAAGTNFAKGHLPIFLAPVSNRPRYRLHCHSSRNNTIVTLTKPDGSTVAWASGGSCGFKKSNRAGYEAGYKCAKTMFDAIRREQSEKKVDLQLELFFKGFGEGREAMKTAMLGAEGAEIRGLVTQITDRTPLKIGGTRSKKTRRV